MTVLIAGGGISGLVLALSCHQVGIPFQVFESASQMRPLGVGINLQPSAVRELFDLGLEAKLDDVGIPLRDYGLYTKRGLHVWTEPRGRDAGYDWPAYSVHRGRLHMLLYNEVIRRAGPDVIQTGQRVTAFDTVGGKAHLSLTDRAGAQRKVEGAVAIGADGIHSAIRRQMQPLEDAPHWGGAMLWRGTTQAKPFLSGGSMVLIGHDGLRFVTYPISSPAPRTGLATINWICNLQFDPAQKFRKEDYSRAANLADFLPAFEQIKFDWLDAPALIRGADEIFEYPMVDRDPLERWAVGRVTLMGDAAHAAYPVGSNGAGAGITDARKLVAAFLAHGLTPKALDTYEAEMLPVTSKIILMNRTAGPDKILDIVENRCGGQFERIEDVIPHTEMADHAATYKRIAGYGVEQTNNRPPIIAQGARFDPRIEIGQNK
ncbi:2-polyprenyl-6-methoxyphenol hydroxylase-like FAD-dependent oxidoreductase [Sulfitobacter guttiformis]|uniref:2-polyprenyl-6-methoxyphenol hydroxylase-like FAD-dependent oxidoreductase n=1 Tax=Sulfitobacter guttiformis TaxID=74349 RepID=A0A420DJK6_9RHOB|nr:flavin-dependent oxidoreductase [Sulfitobacter guttiformis]RKE94388.1 2-polyprenyl-6-methoxyphenol hydroxylase-like FAD-dependent oxidoreductase [Sulfitobacter guttiformis]